MSSRRRETAGRLGAWLRSPMLAVGVLTVYPLYFILITAFKTRAEYLDNRFLPPSDPTLENFRRGLPRRRIAALDRQQRCASPSPASSSPPSSLRLPPTRSPVPASPADACPSWPSRRADGGAAGCARRPAVPLLRRPRPSQLAAGGDHHLRRAAATVLDLPARQLLRHHPPQPRGGRTHRRRRPAAHAVESSSSRSPRRPSSRSWWSTLCGSGTSS